VPGQVEKKLGPVNILVNNAGIVVLGGVLELSPGDWDRVFETNLNAMVAPIKEMPLYDDVIKRTPAGRFGTPEECAGTPIYLASPASDFVTGATIYLDGGFAVQL
jgi:NAD(P)-dependent dehydrogenase (short-subunit alcohol dehydrogenase family)